MGQKIDHSLIASYLYRVKIFVLFPKWKAHLLFTEVLFVAVYLVYFCDRSTDFLFIVSDLCIFISIDIVFGKTSIKFKSRLNLKLKDFSGVPGDRNK